MPLTLNGTMADDDALPAELTQPHHSWSDAGGEGGDLTEAPNAAQLQLWATWRACNFCGIRNVPWNYECRACGLAMCWPHSRGHAETCEAVTETGTRLDPQTGSTLEAERGPWIYAPPGRSCLHCGFSPPNQGKACPLGQCLTCGASVCARHRKKHDKTCYPELAIAAE